MARNPTKQRHKINANHQKAGSKTSSGSIAFTFRDIINYGLVVILALIAGGLHMYHVSTLHQNDRNFNMLSTMEREMGFRTEMGLYYSYFKTMIEAPSVMAGVQALAHNNLTEYPDKINVLKRFNVYPELALGWVYRIFMHLADKFDYVAVTCWRTDRGEGRTPIQSCEGLGDPAYFYLTGVWISAGCTAAFIFLSAYSLSNSKLGGLLAVLCFFYNHEECTRVMWTPPLRESFGYPVSLLQIWLVSMALKAEKGRRSKNLMIWIQMATTVYIMSWQFAQFTLFTQVCLIFGLHSFGLVGKEKISPILFSLMAGLLTGALALFLNEMLLTSWYFSSLLASLVIIQLVEPYMLPRAIGKPANPREGRDGYIVLIRAPLLVGLFLGLTVALKIATSKALGVQDDAHVLNLLKSKVSDYADFDTLLYTCSREFDFLGWEMPNKTTMTLLLPSALLAFILALLRELKHFRDTTASNCNVALLYNIGQTAIYGVMAVGIMRLKLFFTPHLCILAGILCDIKVLPIATSRTTHLAIIAALVAAMTFKGHDNILKSHQRIGEFSDPPMEDLLDWVKASTPQNTAFTGPMPLMANVMLSTRRPIINHPHYEDVGLRQRTRKIYQMYSRRTPQEYHETLLSLKAQYVVLSSGWCLDPPDSPCSMASIMDHEDDKVEAARSKPEAIGKPLCPILFNSLDPKPFKKVFANDVYVVLKV